MRFLLALLLLLAPPAFACGPDTDCKLGERHYRIAMPDGWDGKTPVPALVWSHGYRGSAAGVMRNKSIRNLVSNAGLALIAVQGVRGSWDLPYGPGTFNSNGASEFAYFDAVINDATAHHHIDPDRILASGFSAGGMMVWYLACSHPDKFAGFIPMSGTFWLKPPDTCEGPAASIVHIHGTKDKTVPLTGRAIRETKQGDVQEALDMYQKFGKFGASKDVQIDTLSCRNRTNPTGEILQYCLFDGGHSFSAKMLGHGIAELRDNGKL
ncbi:MAG: prolyl oligopeptidase family serine peptidase [Sulfitobacter sp.]